MEILPLIRGVSGLNTVSDPVRIQYNADSGVSDLSVAVNIDIDKTGRPSRREGFTSLQSGNFHSLWCDGEDCYVGKDTALYQVGADGGIVGVRSGLSGGKIYYCQVHSGVFYSNGSQNGFAVGSNSIAWPIDTYHGPETNRNFSSAPIGTHMGLYKGRIYIAKGPVLWNSELFQYGLFDMAKGFNQFGSDVIMVAPVEAGIFVSDRTATYFMGGVPGEFTLTKVCNYPAVENTLAVNTVEGLEIGLSNPGLCRVWASPEGAILGTSTGQVINLNKEKVVYDENVSNGAGVLKGYQFIHNMY